MAIMDTLKVLGEFSHSVFSNDMLVGRFFFGWEKIHLPNLKDSFKKNEFSVNYHLRGPITQPKQHRHGSWKLDGF